MKKLLTLTGIASIGAVLALIAACQNDWRRRSEISRKEALLAQSGFKVVTVTDPKQQQAVNGLAHGQVFGRDVQREDCSTCFPLRRRTRSTSGNKPNSTSIKRRSRGSRPATQQRCNFQYTQKINQPTQNI